MDHKSNEKIAEALKLLEEVAAQKKDELKDVLTDKYTHLRSVFLESENGLIKSLNDTRNQVVNEAYRAKDAGLEKVREMAGDMDRSVHLNPWTYLAGTAVISLLVGLILDRNRK